MKTTSFLARGRARRASGFWYRVPRCCHIMMAMLQAERAFGSRKPPHLSDRSVPAASGPVHDVVRTMWRPARRALRLIACLAVVLIGVATPARAQDQPSRYCDPEAYTAEDIDAALGACDALLAGKSTLLRDRIRAYQTRGDLLALKGQPDDAISSYDQAVKLLATAGQLTSGSLLDKEIPASVSKILAASVFYHRGEALRAQGQMPLAIADYSKAIEYYEDDAQTWWHRAQAYEANGQIELALRDLDKAVTLRAREPGSI